MGNPRAFVALGNEAIDDDGRQWVEVMPTAEAARNGGKRFVVTPDDLETYATSIRDNAGKTVVDYDHEGAVDGGSTKASGWFTGEAEVRDADDRGPILHAEIQWTPAAAQAIRDGEYRFISAEFSFHDKDEKTGLLTKAKDLIAATLTNRPFFSELAPVTASAVVWDASMGYAQRQAEIYEVLNPGDTWRYCVLDVGDGQALVQENGDDAWVVPFTVGADGEVVLAPVNEWKPAEQQWVAAAKAARATGDATKQTAIKEGNMPHPSEMLEELGLDETADDAAVLAAIKAKGVTPEPTAEEIEAQAKADAEKAQAAKVAAALGANGVIVDKDALATLQAGAAAGEKALAKQAEDRQTGKVNAALEKGKIPPAGVAASLARMARDEDSETAYLDGLPENTIPVVERGGTQTVEASSTEAQLTTVRQALGLKAGRVAA